MGSNYIIPRYALVILVFWGFLERHVVLAVFYRCDPLSSECCNGLPNLCGQRINDVLMGMVHNSMSSSENGFIIGGNHIDNAFPDALDAGYRALSIDLCNCNGNLRFCHGGQEVGCGIGRRDPVELLGIVNDWLENHPNDVIVIYLEIDEDAGGPISLADVDQLVNSIAPGSNSFRSKFYIHDDTQPWPTLKNLIESGSQVVFFYIRGPNGNGVHPPGIHHFFDYAMENDFSYESIDELEDITIGQNCPIDRGFSSTRDFFLMNNFITRNSLFGQFLPSQDAARQINTGSFVATTLAACEQAHDQEPNFVSVDFWHEGNLIDFVQDRNAELVPVETPSPTTLMPTMLPTTSEPTLAPSSQPSLHPSLRPSSGPSSIPSAIPSTMPTIHASGKPSSEPTFTPSSQSPSISPSLSMEPSSHSPSLPPSMGETSEDEEEAATSSEVPSDAPSLIPSKNSAHPSDSPSVGPSLSIRPTEMRPTASPVALTPVASFSSENPSGCPERRSTVLLTTFIAAGVWGIFFLSG